MVSLLAITGAASLKGIWMHKRVRDKNQIHQNHGAAQTAKQPWWRASWHSVQETLQRTRQRLTARHALSAAPALALTEDQPDPYAAINYGLRASALALGVTTTGRLCFPPLIIAGLPFLIYLGIPPAQAAYEQLWVDGRPSRALAETTAVAVCLASGYYWVGSLGFCLYYGGWRLWAKRQGEALHRSESLALTTTHLWKAGDVCAVPIATLQPGDQVLLSSGELSPVDGVITEGVAWLRSQALSATACGLRKSIGDRVTATDIVLVGRICVRVLPVA